MNYKPCSQKGKSNNIRNMSTCSFIGVFLKNTLDTCDICNVHSIMHIMPLYVYTVFLYLRVSYTISWCFGKVYYTVFDNSYSIRVGYALSMSFPRLMLLEITLLHFLSLDFHRIFGSSVHDWCF